MANQKTDYQLHRFTEEQLSNLHRNVRGYAQAIDGLPTHPTEVLEKRGWLLPYLFGYDSLLWGRWDYWFGICRRSP